MAATKRIKAGLLKKFERHRVVFWYDSKEDLRDEFEALELTGVEKVELDNNEFEVKYRLLREMPKEKFLLYKCGPQPPDLDNWLLDVLLTEGLFDTDQASIWLGEVGLGIEYTDLTRDHPQYFNTAKRRDCLKTMLDESDTLAGVRLKMLAVCVGSEPAIAAVLKSLLAEAAKERGEKIGLISSCGLATFFWGRVRLDYGYESAEPNIQDFVLALFKSCYAMSLGETSRLKPEAQVFLKEWKNNRLSTESFRILSGRCARDLQIDENLVERDIRDLEGIDYFRVIDEKILVDLVRAVIDGTISAQECDRIVGARRVGHWYAEFEDSYLAVSYASRFLDLLKEIKPMMESIDAGIENYSRTWFKLDQCYRRFIFRARACDQASLRETLVEKIDDFYSNHFLLPINDSWQGLLDKADGWSASSITPQTAFFTSQVIPLLNKDQKVVVVISDGLRYEIGAELVERVRSLARFEADVEPMLASLPSYTQLGMAALLPHTELTIRDDKMGSVLVDGRDSRGTANRGKILSLAGSKCTVAIQAADFLGLSYEENRSFVKDHDLVYVYHNHIDATGDDPKTEERVFEAVKTSLEELEKIIKRASDGASNIIVTADHGFIYQSHALAESDYSTADATGQGVTKKDRRFVVGRGLKAHPGLRKMSAAELGLGGDLEFQIAKSINRLRLSGSGSRYVHGGASLQEVVLPIVKIKKRQQSGTTEVDVEILKGGVSVITTGQLLITFYQTEPVREKVLPRKVRVGLYADDNKLISDIHEILFDSDSDNAREREKQIQVTLTNEAEQYNEQEVVLRLDELVFARSSEYREYNSVRYSLRRSFSSDFDS